MPAYTETRVITRPSEVLTLVRWTSSRWADWDTSGSEDTHTMCSHTSDSVLHYQRRRKSHNTQRFYSNCSFRSIGRGFIFGFTEKINVLLLIWIQRLSIRPLLTWAIGHYGSFLQHFKGSLHPNNRNRTFSRCADGSGVARLPLRQNNKGKFNLWCLQQIKPADGRIYSMLTSLCTISLAKNSWQAFFQQEHLKQTSSLHGYCQWRYMDHFPPSLFIFFTSLQTKREI